MRKGIVISYANYTYEGDIIDKDPHGYGIFKYANGDIYKGHCKYGRPDGFGLYMYKSNAIYTGFFSGGKIHGIGTFEDLKNIYKGTWCNDKKHGMFYRTNKINYKTYLQKWIKGKLIKYHIIQYIQPNALQTTKQNPCNAKTKHQKEFKGCEKKCMLCCEKFINAVNDLCGHVIGCSECLKKCNTCPICRAPIKNIIKLYLS
mgnify:FL=1